MEYYEKTINSERLYNGKVINLRIDNVMLPDGKTSTREIIEHNGGVAIVAVKNNKIVLVRQFRKPLDDVIYEIPAGKIDGNEEPDKCAYREMEEETGLIPVNLKLLAQIYTAPGFSNERLYIYFEDKFVEGTVKRDEDEFMDVYYFEIPEVINMIKKGMINDAKTICGVLMYLQVINDK